MANLLSASSVANLQKNAPKWSEFSGAGTVLALSLIILTVNYFFGFSPRLSP
jgi:hypothetical protein